MCGLCVHGLFLRIGRNILLALFPYLKHPSYWMTLVTMSKTSYRQNFHRFQNLNTITVTTCKQICTQLYPKHLCLSESASGHNPVCTVLHWARTMTHNNEWNEWTFVLEHHVAPIVLRAMSKMDSINTVAYISLLCLRGWHYCHPSQGKEGMAQQEHWAWSKQLL